MSSSLFSTLHFSPPPLLQPLSYRLTPPPPPPSLLATLNSTSLSSPTKTLSLSPFPKSTRRPFTRLAINLRLTGGNPEENPSKNLNFDGFLRRARDLFDKLPQPVKKFPWAKTLRNLLLLILDLTASVFKYLAVPVLALSQLSEMSYCAHERKMVLIPFPFVFGFAVAGVFKDTAVELSSDLKEGAFPWHLLVIGIVFALLKLPGPYYPYWGRLLIPHFANGGLWRTAWLAFMWYRGTPSSPVGEST